MRGKTQSGVGRSLVLAFVAIAALLPNARADESLNKDESRCVDRGKRGTHDLSGECRDSRNNGVVQGSTEDEKGKKWNLFRV